MSTFADSDLRLIALNLAAEHSLSPDAATTVATAQAYYDFLTTMPVRGQHLPASLRATFDRRDFGGDLA